MSSSILYLWLYGLLSFITY